MKLKILKKIGVALCFGGLLIVAGCHKTTTAAKAPEAPPPAPAPTVTLTAMPSNIVRGQSSELSWSTSNATDITISGLGTVPASGQRSVSPSESTTYELTAKGPGGTNDASARVSVSMPAPTATRNSEAEISEEALFARSIQDVFFDYNKHDIRTDQMQPLESDASFLKQHSDIKVLIEGHCDERGTEEYNLGLGDQRATTTKDTLVNLGVPASRIDIVSYGKERPFCTDENETCWRKNRRGHFVFEHTTTSANR